MPTLAGEQNTVRKPGGVTRVLGLFAVLALLVGAAVVFGLLPRLSRQKQFLAEASTDIERLPVVTVVPVTRGSSKSDLELPGTLLAMNEAPIYARVDGYIKSRFIDIGVQVKQGALMAELDTPELDQQIRQGEAAITQAEATVKQHEAAIRQAKANSQLAGITAGRVSRLADEGVLSKQELDNAKATLEAREADVAAAEANLNAAKSGVTASQANLQRLRETKVFARITAPFDGYVTYRSPDVGSLITAGNGNPKSEMFRVADIDPMRIFVSVPQGFIPQVQPTAGSHAELTVEQFPGRVFTADVRRSNAALDPASRTMLTVLYIANPKAELLPGMFGQVRFHVGNDTKRFVLPGEALVTRSGARYVAIATPDGTVHFRKIEVGRDLGSTFEVYSGVSEGDLVIANPTDEIRENAKVTIRNKK